MQAIEHGGYSMGAKVKRNLNATIDVPGPG